MRIDGIEDASLDSEWIRSAAENQVPYYINHGQQSTQWDHPQMSQLMKSLCKLNDVRFSAYRLAMKVRAIQKHLCMHLVDIASLVSAFEENGLGFCEDILDIEKMTKVVQAFFDLLHDDHPKLINVSLSVELVLNWLLNVYDPSRSGQVRTLSFKVLLVLMCKAHLEEKYRYIFRLVADSSGRVDERHFALLLHDCQQIPRALGELAAFGGSNIEPSVRSCFKKLQNGRHHVTINEFLDWLKMEPQSLVWLPVLHRLSAAESARHQSKCSICKQYPIIGFRYRCLRCFNFDMCQNCFFAGRTAKHHKLSHPMNEYCTTTTSGEDMKDFTQMCKNKLRSKRYFKKHPRLGYLPVQTVKEGDQIESPAPTPRHWSTTTFEVQPSTSGNVEVGPASPTTHMHSRMEVYAHRLAQVEDSDKTENSKSSEMDEEHKLIAAYCASLQSTGSTDRKKQQQLVSPLQMMVSVEAEQRLEFEEMIRDLEDENKRLQQEYESLCSQVENHCQVDEGRSNVGTEGSSDLIAEARLLRQHKGRLEARMQILEEHNTQLEAQLKRLHQLFSNQSSNSTTSLPRLRAGGSSLLTSCSQTSLPNTPSRRTLNSSRYSYTDPREVRYRDSSLDRSSLSGRSETEGELDEQQFSPPLVTQRKDSLSSLLQMANQVGKAVGTLVNVMTDDEKDEDDDGDKKNEKIDLK